MKRNKCKFIDHVEYLGHTVDSERLHVNPDKIKALVNALRHQNVIELRAYVGLVNLSKFIANLTTTLQPRNSLLQKIL